MSRLIGIVVCGGKSSRMGRDKSLIEYHGKPQRYHMYDLLNTVCNEVVLSCNEDQATEIDSTYNFFSDLPAFRAIGPMAALLSAMELYPEAAFMLIGCDYPFLERSDLQLLLNTRNMEPLAVAYYNDEFRHHEPLLAIYEPGIKPDLVQNFNQGNYSLKQLLKKVNAYKLLPDNIDAIRSIDTPEEYEAVIEMLHIVEH